MTEQIKISVKFLTSCQPVVRNSLRDLWKWEKAHGIIGEYTEEYIHGDILFTFNPKTSANSNSIKFLRKIEVQSWNESDSKELYDLCWKIFMEDAHVEP